MGWLAVPLWDVANGQGLRRLAELGLALLLSSLIGWEREARRKSAGLRTRTLVGVAGALMMEVSQHGSPLCSAWTTSPSTRPGRRRGSSPASASSAVARSSYGGTRCAG